MGALLNMIPGFSYVKLGVYAAIAIAFGVLYWMWSDAASDRDAANVELGKATAAVMSAKQTNKDLNAQYDALKLEAKRNADLAAQLAQDKQKRTDELATILKENKDEETKRGVQSASPIVDRTLRRLLSAASSPSGAGDSARSEARPAASPEGAVRPRAAAPNR